MEAQLEGAVVSSIEITGAHKMDRDFLLARLKSKLSSNTSWAQLDLDQHRLNRLNGVQHTVIEVDTLADASLRVRFDVTGQKTIKPNVGLGAIKENFWYKVGAAEYNLGRKNQTLLGFFLSQDGRPNGKLYFENPFYKGSDWGFFINAFHTASFEPLYFNDGVVDYKYDLTGIGVGAMNHIGLLDKLTYGITYFREEYNKLNLDIENTSGPDFLTQQKLLFSIGYLHDKLEYDFFYRTGYQHQLLAQSVITAGEDLRFFSLAYEWRQFWKVGRTTNFAGQLRMAIGTNNDTPFAPFVLDSNFNIRGVGNRVDRATAQFVLNLEVRQTAYHNKNFAIQVIAFSDSGSWRAPGANFKVIFEKENFRSFIGGGARFILTKVFDSVIRLDYGVDLFDTKQRGFVLGFGQFF